MNINIFFILIIAGLTAIFFLFEPIKINEQKVGDIPIFELEKFKIIELNDKGLSTVMDGVRGIKYANRYVIFDVDYTDNSKKYLSNIKAKNGLYKGDIIDLNDDVVYSREDGLVFKTQKASYNNKSGVAISHVKYTSYMNGHKAEGSYIKYNSILGTTKSKNIVANYKLKERK